MDFGVDAQTEAFRREVRDFLAAHLTDEVRERMETTGTHHDWGLHRALGEHGWIGAAWPAHEGGQDRDPYQLDALYEECVRAGAPVDGLSTTMIVAETLRRVGTSEQRERLIPPIQRGEIVISLGYSEPEAGSDVASVATSAIRDGEDWVINGQKAFTTLAHEAAYVFLLARTDPDAAKHRGLTLFLVPTDARGFSLDPVHTLGGERTNMTYYDDVVVSDAARVGEVNEGWSVLLVALDFERGGEFVGRLARLTELAGAWMRDTGRLEDPLAAERLGRALTDAEVARLLGARATWLRAEGDRSDVEGTIAKLFVSEAFVRASAELVSAADAQGLRQAGDPRAPLEGMLEHMFRHAVVTTIYGGTSEILRGIVAERRLGLPRSR